MQEYKVISLSVSGKAPRKVYYSGELVNQDNLNAPVEELERMGFIEKVEEGYKAPEIHIPDDPFTPFVSSPEKEDLTVVGEVKNEKPQGEDLKRSEMMEELEALGVKFNKNASKAELFDLYKAEKAKKSGDQQE